MNEDIDRLNASQKPAPQKKLADDLATLDTRAGSTLPMESDMLSLIVSGTLNGEDLSRRYPAFYQKLLENASLRQAFLDALASVEAEHAGQLLPLPEASKATLAFLAGQPSAPRVEILAERNWRAVWQRPLEQLQAIFSPPRLAYRADPNLLEDPWFTLLREEITAAGAQYAVALECTLSDDHDDALSTVLNLAVTLGTSSEPVQFPLRASLQWGAYQESVQISEEGRIKFPDIPLAAIYDPSHKKIQAGLSLILETAS